MDRIEAAVKAGRSALNEYEAKQFLAAFEIPVCREVWTRDDETAVKAARGLGYPVVLKAAGVGLQHKTELGAVALNLKTAAEVRKEARRMLAIAGCEGLLVQEMIRGDRELVCGLTRDAQFGPCVMFGLGGIFTEVIDDVVFRVVPLAVSDALEMMEEIRAATILRQFRGQSPVDKSTLARMLVAVGEIGCRHEAVTAIDINPVKIRADGSPVAVDALVAIRTGTANRSEERRVGKEC
jgi:acetate---CoA ligase (ADP-forming) subunit beta